MMISRLAHRCCSPLDDDEGVSAGSVGIAAAPPAQRAFPVLDAEALRRLRELDPSGANRLLERVFQAFETSTLRLIPQLNDAQRLGDFAGVRHVAHTLKSSSASIGAIKLSQLCAEIETMIRLDTHEPIPARVEQLIRETSIVLQALKQLPGVPS